LRLIPLRLLSGFTSTHAHVIVKLLVRLILALGIGLRGFTAIVCGWRVLETWRNLLDVKVGVWFEGTILRLSVVVELIKVRISLFSWRTVKSIDIVTISSLGEFLGLLINLRLIRHPLHFLLVFLLFKFVSHAVHSSLGLQLLLVYSGITTQVLNPCR
jgi:hypothetical protein